MRHTTSKLREFDDLGRLRSVGFRGEALSSLAALSSRTVTSRPSSSADSTIPHPPASVSIRVPTSAAELSAASALLHDLEGQPVQLKQLEHLAGAADAGHKTRASRPPAFRVAV